jgi:hypothetical protein
MNEENNIIEPVIETEEVNKSTKEKVKDAFNQANETFNEAANSDVKKKDLWKTNLLIIAGFATVLVGL